MSPTSWAVVLTGRDEQPAVLRPGILAFPLDARVARRPELVGPEVTVTANLLHLLPFNRSVVIVVNAGAAVGPVADEVIRIAYGLLDPADAGAALTVAVASPRPVRPGTAGRSCLFNTSFEAMPEALVESVAAARRGGLLTRQGGSVLILQRFAAATASAVVHVTPNLRHDVRISAQWGIIEVDDDAAADEFTVRGGAVLGTLARKETASVTAAGGTRTVSLPARRHYRYALPKAAVLRLADTARDAARIAGVPLSLDIAMVGGEPVVVRCRPCTGKY